MARREKRDKKKKDKYQSLSVISYLIRLICGILIFLTGFYYKAIVEELSGLGALAYGIYKLSTMDKRFNPVKIKRLEQNRFKYLLIFMVYFSIVNPIGLLAIAFDLYKRDRVILGGFDEEKK